MSRRWHRVCRVAVGLLALALASLNGGCTLPAPTETTPDLAPTTVTPAATATMAPPTATSEDVLWEPLPTLPTEPGLIEVIELPGPPAPGLGPGALALVKGQLYTANEESRNLSFIEENAVSRTLPLEQGPYQLVPDAQRERVYVLNQFGHSILVVQDAEQVARWELPFEPTAGTVLGEVLWVGGMAGQLVRLDVATGAPQTPDPPDMEGMIQDLTAVGDRVLVGSHQELALYDAQSLERLASQPINGYRTLAVTDDMLYLCTDDLTTGASWLERWDLGALAALARLEVPADAGALWVNQEGTRAIMAGVTSHRLYLLDLATGALLGETVAGLAPREMLYAADMDRLYISQGESHTVAVVSPEDLGLIEVIPLALQITALAAGPEPGSLLVGLNTGEIRLLRRQGAASIWQVGVFPSEIAYVPALNRIAVVDRAVGELVLLDQGHVARRYPTGPNPQGLFVDALHQALYAGDLRLYWSTEALATMHIPAGLDETYPPVGILRDTRRDRLYAIAWNGIPGSNGGYRIVGEESGVWNEKLPAPGQLGVIEAVYDARTDRFYSTYAHMGQFGLQIAEGETTEEVAHITLDRYPQAMILHAELWRIWLALPAAAGSAEGEHTRLLALDTRTLSPVAALAVPDRIAHMALDPATQRLYLADDDEGRIYVVQDVALPAPPLPTETPTQVPATEPPPPTTATPVPTATMPATATPPAPTAAPTASPASTPTEACEYEVHPELRTAWEAARPGGLGCARGPSQAGQWGWQLFEHGEMFWYGATRQILILYADGTWTLVDDHWHEGMPDLSCDAMPPPGLWQPIRGFGLAWCQAPGVRERLGWALQSEEAFESLYQPFAGGSLITHPQGGAFWLDRSGTHYRVLPPATP